MIKSLLIKLRKKPKVVREHVALGSAGVFTFIVFAVWAFTLPSKFSDTGDSQPASIFSTLKNEITKEAPDLSEIADEFKEVVATTTEPSVEGDEDIIFEDSTIEIDLDSSLSDPNSRPIRIATTSSASSSSESQNMLE